MTKEKIIESITEYMLNAVRSEVHGVNLEDVEPKIYYMNGNDGTEFDWDMNGRTCEFFLFYKETELGFMKAYITDNNKIRGIWWDELGEGSHHRLAETDFSVNDVEYVPDILASEFDDQHIFDSVVKEVDFSKIKASQKES